MPQPLVQVRRERLAGGEIARLLFDRPARLNALSTDLMAEFVDAMAALSADEPLRAVVIQGAGRAFVGGADVDDLAALDSPAAARRFIERVHACCRAVRDCPVPVIAAIGGWCLGAGLELAAACDLRIAAAGARLGMPEVKLGIPSVVEAALLPQLVGWGRTRELLLFGETIDAQAALRIGLVEEVAPDGALEEVLAHRLTSLMSAQPRAVRLQKALIRRWEALSLDQAIAAGVDAFAAAFESDEPIRAIAAHQADRATRRRR